MIGFLKGKIIHKSDTVIVLVDGVGYEVSLPQNILIDVKTNKEYEFWVRTVSNDKGVCLYGFTNIEGRNVFDLLTTVSGIGPKTALGIVSCASSSDLLNAIVNEDKDLLTSGFGISKRYADKIVLELSKKIRGGSDKTSGEFVEIIEALKRLGYEEKVAREVTTEAVKQKGSVEEKLSFALKFLGSKR